MKDDNNSQKLSESNGSESKKEEKTQGIDLSLIPVEDLADAICLRVPAVVLLYDPRAWQEKEASSWFYKYSAPLPLKVAFKDILSRDVENHMRYDVDPKTEPEDDDADT